MPLRLDRGTGTFYIGKADKARIAEINLHHHETLKARNHMKQVNWSTFIHVSSGLLNWSLPYFGTVSDTVSEYSRMKKSKIVKTHLLLSAVTQAPK